MATAGGKPRVAAAYALGRFKSRKVAEALIPVLTDADPEVRAGAAASLGRVRSKEALDLLIQRLADDTPEVRKAVVRALGLIGSERATPHLLNVLRTDRDNKVREEALEALGDVGSVEVVGPLVEAHASLLAAYHAAKALTQVSVGTLAMALPPLLRHERNFVRIKAVKAAGYYCDGPDLLDEISRLAESDPEEGVRVAAGEALKRYGNKLNVLGKGVV